MQGDVQEVRHRHLSQGWRICRVQQDNLFRIANVLKIKGGFLRILKLNLTNREWILLVVLFLIEFTRGAFFLTFLPVYAVKYLGISVASVGLAVSAHYLMETLSKGMAGLLFDRHGRPVVLAGLIIALAGIWGLSFSTGPLGQFIAAAVFGLGISPVWPAVISLVAPVDMPGRASRMGAVFTFWLSGMGAGPVLINFAISHSYNMAIWLLIVLYISAVTTAFWVFPKEKNTGKVPAGSLWGELKRLAALPAVTRILLPGMFLQTMAASLLLPVLPLYASAVLGLNHNQYAFLLISGGAATLVFLVPMGKLVDSLPLKILLSAGFSFSALFLFVFTLVQNYLFIFLLAALVGISYAIVLPAWNALLARVISVKLQATGWGIFGTIEGLGIAAGPALGGIIANMLGPAGTVYCSSIILTILALFYLLYPVDSSLQKEG
ncbi:MFS family permease [Desulfohalotomaculum tongense]|uniref:MFS transporter n=1 Tax=Desulforadius tongensis TaxID=1216062 RepID=UPI00195BC5AB|nr:MFS transporter [Desulforadius tongensis]MBM7855920.1 MFS family permease [Desulforadius tongensis]